jgi:peptide/nickel transport system ATP-binding protein/oligopeptide transport system ATP-binding protein
MSAKVKKNPMAPEAAELDVKGLSVAYRTSAGNRPVVADVSFSAAPGEALGIVGESGSGKSTAVIASIGLLDRETADISAEHSRFGDVDLISGDAASVGVLGPKIGIIFQNPLVALNPVLTIGRQLTDHMRYHLHLGSREARRRAVALLKEVGISDAERRLESFPHEFSGGMLQRVTIAMALACDPDLLVADEPTTALDATVQADVVDLVLSLRASRKLGLIWITHDLGLLSRIADRVAVMYAGRVVEVGPADLILNHPLHPYTQGLLAAVRSLWQGDGDIFETIPGSPPGDVASIKGCAFLPRCPLAGPKCVAERPALLAAGDVPGHDVACWNAARAGPAK